MFRKPLPSAKIKTLPDDVQNALLEFCEKNTLAQAVAWLEEKHGIKSSDSAVSEWRSWRLLLRNVQTYNAQADELADALRARGDVPEDLVSRIAEAVFLSRASKDGDAKTFAAVASIIQRANESRFEEWRAKEVLELKRQQIEISRQELARKNKALEAQIAKAKKALSAETKLTDEERVARMRAVFGK